LSASEAEEHDLDAIVAVKGAAQRSILGDFKLVQQVLDRDVIGHMLLPEVRLR
jgi:hypothetical protein